MTRPPRRPPKVMVEDARTYIIEASARVLAYWDRVRGDNFAPALGRDLHLDEMEVSLIPCISIVDVLKDEDDFFYRFWGTRNVDVKGVELTGKRLSEAPLPSIVENGRFQFSEVVWRRAPTAFIYVDHYNSAIPREQTTFRFPLSSDGVKVDGILSYQDLDNQSDKWIPMFENMWDGERPDLRLGRTPVARGEPGDC